MEYSDINTLMQLRDDARSVAIANFMDNNPGVDWRTLSDSDFEEQIIKPTLGIFGVENEAKLQEVFKLESTPQKFENRGVVDSDVFNKKDPKKGTTVFIATESKPIPIYDIEDPKEKLPKELRGYQDEYYAMSNAIAFLSKDIPTAKSNAEISAIHDKIIPLLNNQAEIADKFFTSEYNPLKKDDYFDRDGGILESKLNKYYPNAKVVRKSIYGDEFSGFLKDIEKAKDRGDEVITVMINHADNRTNKIFGKSEEEVYGKVAELGSNIYCANCQDETQPEVLQKVTYGVDAYYPTFLPLKNKDLHRTWGGVNKDAGKGKSLDETLQNLLYTIHDKSVNSEEDIYVGESYTKGKPLFKKVAAIIPNRNVEPIDKLQTLPVKPINKTQKFKRGGVVLPDPVLDLISRLKTNK